MILSEPDYLRKIFETHARFSVGNDPKRVKKKVEELMREHREVNTPHSHNKLSNPQRISKSVSLKWYARGGLFDQMALRAAKNTRESPSTLKRYVEKEVKRSLENLVGLLLMQVRPPSTEKGRKLFEIYGDMLEGVLYELCAPIFYLDPEQMFQNLSKAFSIIDEKEFDAVKPVFLENTLKSVERAVPLDVLKKLTIR